MHIFFCMNVSLYFFGEKDPGLQMLGPNARMFNFLRNCQTVL